MPANESRDGRSYRDRDDAACVIVDNNTPLTNRKEKRGGSTGNDELFAD